MGGKWITALDIGTATIKAIVAESRGGRPVIRGVFKEPSGGVKKGAVLDLADATTSVSKVLSEVKRVSKTAVKTVYVNVGTHQVKTQGSRGIVAVSRADSEIYEDDIERVRKASQAVSLAPNRIIAHNITREYVVDGVGDIVDPLGLSGNRLEANSLIVDAFAPHVKNVMRVVELAGGTIAGLVLGAMAASRAVLSKNQRDVGTVVVDIGAGTTSISIWEENKLVNVAVFPVGAGNITNDVAIGLRIPIASAESVKLNYGYAVARDVGVKESFDLKKFSPEHEGVVSRRLVAEIIEARLAEILELVNTELRLAGKAGQLAGGAVFVGGGAKLPGLTEIARQELKLTSRIGSALGDEWVREEVNGAGEVFEDPEQVTALGLALWGADTEGWKGDGTPSIVKKLIRYFSP